MHEQFNPFIGDLAARNSPALLPTNVKATHYDIELEPDLPNATFQGSVTVHFDVLKDSSFILLNAVELEILSTEIFKASENVIKVPKVYYNEAKQTMKVPLEEPISAGSTIQLRQTFNGRLNDAKTNAGFNRSVYRGFDGQSKWMGSTQNQPTGCRRIFPCIDEPAAKATFSATLIVDQGLTCLSNMDIASEALMDKTLALTANKKKVVFNKTPPMSSYLIAFIVAELNYIESTEYRVPVRLYAAPDQPVDDARLSLDIGTRAMIQHEKTFGSPYPLPKLDMVAVPGHSGAMENWGCVIYDDKLLLRDESNSSAMDNHRTALVITHELAHQWFGNIVTTKWWDSTWLNESFADWAAYHALNEMFPSWDIWSDFVAAYPGGNVQGYQGALDLDSYRSSHPIEVPVSTPGQISQIFDAITYGKGSVVLRMIAEYLSLEVFIKGVRLHLERHSFGNATTNDLWDSLSAISGKNVKKIMETWTKNVGYPVLFVTEHDTSGTIEIEQHRFLQSGKIIPRYDKVLYPVYLKIKTQKGINDEAKLFGRREKFSVDFGFYKLNASQTGLYRVSYPVKRWHKLGNQLYTGLLSPDDRVGLISDFCALVKSAQGTQARTSDFLSFLQRFQDETNVFVWRQVLVSLLTIKKAWMFQDPTTRLALDQFQIRLMSKVLRRFGHKLWEFKPEDSHNEQSFKAIIFSNAANYEPVHKAALDLFDRFMDDDYQSLSPNIRKAVFSIVLSDENSSESQYNAVLSTFRNTSSLLVRADAFASLGMAENPDLIERTLAIANSSEIQSFNERNSVFDSILTHPNGVERSWKWLQTNWEKLSNEPESFTSWAIVSTCTSSLSTHSQLCEVEKFFEEKDTRKYDKYISKGLDEIRGKMSWVDRDGNEVAKWLKSNGYS